MAIFKPKAGPIIQWSRLVHMLEAATVTAFGGLQWGYSGAVWFGAGIIVLGFLWEVANKYFIPGNHRFGDALDYWAFVIGATAAGIGWIVVTKAL